MAEATLKKTTRKTTTPRKSARKESIASLSTISVSENQIKSAKAGSLKIKRSYVLTALIVIVVVIVLFLARSYIVAAVVNGQPISRLSVVRELEQQGGKQALDSLVTKSLILQEAQKRNIVISQNDVDSELKTIDANLSKQGQKLDQVLALQGMTKDQLVEQIKLQKMLEKMVGNIAVSNKEIDDYIASNAASLPQNQDENTQRQSVKTNLAQQKLNEKAQALLSELRKNAKIDYYVSY